MMIPLPKLPQMEVDTGDGNYRVICWREDGGVIATAALMLARRKNFYAADQCLWQFVRRELMNGWQISQHDPSDAFGAYQLTYDHPTKGTLILMIGVIGGTDQ